MRKPDFGSVVEFTTEHTLYDGPTVPVGTRARVVRSDWITDEAPLLALDVYLKGQTVRGTAPVEAVRELTGLRLYVYRTPAMADCSLNGLSSRYDTVTALDVDGPFPASDEAPAVTLHLRDLGPCVLPFGVALHEAMFGGAYVAASDSRWSRACGIYGAVAFHDRIEKP